MSEPTTAEHSGDQAACLAARLVAAKTKLSAAENELEASECGHDQAAVAKQELVVAKAKLRVADAELELAKHRLEIAEADGDPAAVAESKVGVAKQEVGVAEAKVGVAKQEVGVARAEEKPAAITILGGANCGLRLAQIAYEQALQACTCFLVWCTVGFRVLCGRKFWWCMDAVLVLRSLKSLFWLPLLAATLDVVVPCVVPASLSPYPSAVPRSCQIQPRFRTGLRFLVCFLASAVFRLLELLQCHVNLCSPSLVWNIQADTFPVFHCSSQTGQTTTTKKQPADPTRPCSLRHL